MTAAALELPSSIARVLKQRRISSAEQMQKFLSPSLNHLGSPETFSHMKIAVDRIREAIRTEQTIAIYADRDVDGLTGLAILVRTLRTLGANIRWGCPLKGRGLERPVLEGLVRQEARVMILVDCGAGEGPELGWLASRGIEVIVADHHRLSVDPSSALAWIHPEVMGVPALSAGRQADREENYTEVPAGCVMAFKLAQALWISFLGNEQPERLDYFLFDHLDLLCLGILADRMPLLGENRVLVYHGLRRLAKTRKAGLAALLRFFRLASRSGPVNVHEATWQIIPLLNAAGRLGQPEKAADLLLTEDPGVARECIDALIALNTQRRTEQVKSLDLFESTVLEQCAVESDPVIVAIAKGLHPSVTGLAAQSMVKKYGRPAFLFVDQGEEAVGSARGTPDVDLFSWVEEHRDLLVKFGGHRGAVGLTVRTADFTTLRDGLMGRALRQGNPRRGGLPVAEVEVAIGEIDAAWWEHFQRLEPFGPGFPSPVFQITGIETIRPANKRKEQRLILKSGSLELIAEVERIENESFGEGPWTVVGTPVAAPKEDVPIKWMIQEVHRVHG